MIALAFVLSTAIASAGAGLRVVDGDRLVVGQERIRLSGIDAPESGQVCTRRDGTHWACGAAATTELLRLVASDGLDCTGQRHDVYGRRLARCRGAAGDLGQALVAAGLATAFGDEAALYRLAERQAVTAGVGIWQSVSPLIAATLPAKIRCQRTV